MTETAFLKFQSFEFAGYLVLACLAVGRGSGAFLPLDRTESLAKTQIEPLT